VKGKPFAATISRKTNVLPFTLSAFTAVPIPAPALTPLAGLQGKAFGHQIEIH
jgi:hypothetical protein